jgi:hypothetical protein
MNFNGIWRNTLSGELIQIESTENDDEYLLSHGQDFCKSEKIDIILTNATLAHIPVSKKFGHQFISIQSSNSFKISQDLWGRQ